MKVFTQTYDLAKASPHRFWVAPFSEFKIGIKILEKDEISAKDFTLKAGSTEFTPDEDKIDNFTLFTIKSNDTGFVEYTIEVEGVAEKLKLMQIVTDSTVFEIDAGGGDVPADVATKTWVNSQISDFVEEDELTAYATKDELTAYAETDDLTAYYTKSETSSATEIGTALAGKQPAGNYLTAETEPAFAAMSADIVVDGDLTAYYTKSETSSATEIGTALAGKQPTGNYLTAETDPTFNTWLSGESFGIGEGAQVGSRAIAIGYYGKALGQYSVAIGGPNCNALANSAIQLGDGTNLTDGMFQVFSYPMLSSDGKIPNERLHLSAVSESDWATLSGSADAGTFYFVY